MLLYQHQLVELFPKARWIVIERDSREVEDSFISACNREELISGGLARVWTKVREAFEQTIHLPNCIRVQFSLLGNQSMVEQIWDYCLDGLPWNQCRYDLLRDLRVEPVLSKYKELICPRSLQL